MAANFSISIPIDDGGVQVKNRCPSWCVAVARFTSPAAINVVEGDRAELLKTTLDIIQNDCLNVNVSRPKAGFAKMASITLKSTDIWWPNVIAPGDWVACWMHDWPEDTQRIVAALQRVKQGGTGGPELNNWDSGLKFVGRILTMRESDAISANGVRVPVHTISAQQGLEFATSIYYNYLAGLAVNPAISTPSGNASSDNDQQRVTNLNTAAQWNALKSSIETRAGGQVADFAAKFKQLYEGRTDWSPDNMVSIMFQLTMGINRETNVVNTSGLNGSPNNAINTSGLNGSPNNAIMIPSQVAQIFNRPNKQNLWQMYNVLAGTQKYSGKGSNPWERMFPDMSPDVGSGVTNDIVYWTSGLRCQGFIPFYPPSWDNRPIWSILGTYTNDVVNEMYTALRINKYNQILPTLVIREKPFSTGLVESMSPIPTNITNPELQQRTVVSQPGDDQNQIAEQQSRITYGAPGFVVPFAKGNGLDSRTLFSEVPRWVIDESYIKSVDTSCNEANRINFVQVWGRSSGAEFAGVRAEIAGPEALKQAQALAGNWVCDKSDVTRNGLRTDIVESPFDVLPDKGQTLARVWAQKRADWLFNGHLKLAGTVVLLGVVEPICEGDNCMIRGIVYHIENIGFQCSLSPGGLRSFDTVLTVSNGLANKGLDNSRNPPIYSIQLPYDNAFNREIPRDGSNEGYSEVQTLNGSETRVQSGSDIGEKSGDQS